MAPMRPAVSVDTLPPMRSAPAPMLAKLGCRLRHARPVRDHDRQDARVPGSGLSGRGTDAGPSGRASPVRVAGALKMHGIEFRHRASSGRQPGAGELHDALSGPALCPAQHLRAPCRGAVPVGGLAGPYPGRAASLHHGGHRAGVQGGRHSGGAAPHDRAAGHSSRDRDGGRASAR